MNERIRELAKKSGYVYHVGGTVPYFEFSKNQLEKFVKLIVEECADIITDIPSSPQGSWSDGYYEGCTDSAKQIKKHFGVEL